MNYLDEIVRQVENRPIPWDGYSRGNDISEENAAVLKKTTVSGIDPAAAEQYAAAVSQVLKAPSQDDIVRYVLVLASKLHGDATFATLLAKQDQFWASLSSLLGCSDEQIRILAANLQTQIASVAIAPVESVSALFRYLADLVTGESPSHPELALQWTSLLLQTKVYRPQFWEFHAKFIPEIDSLIKPPPKGGLQAQYHGLLALWLLSFDADLAVKLSTDYLTVDTVLQVAKTAVKEKITRVAVATLVNLVRFAPTAASALIGQHGLPVIRSLAERKWSDEELREDIVSLRDTLTKAFDSMSTFDVYLSELNSKHLQWSPPHRSEAFWKTNIADFAASDYKILRKLIKLLLASTVPLNQAIACNDIANIINEDPESTTVLNDENAKARIMGLMESSDAEVRYEALRATQAFISKLLK